MDGLNIPMARLSRWSDIGSGYAHDGDAEGPGELVGHDGKHDRRHADGHEPRVGHDVPHGADQLDGPEDAAAVEDQGDETRISAMPAHMTMPGMKLAAPARQTMRPTMTPGCRDLLDHVLFAFHRPRVVQAYAEAQEHVEQADDKGQEQHRDHGFHAVPRDAEYRHRVEPAHRLAEVTEKFAEQEPEHNCRHRGYQHDVREVLEPLRPGTGLDRDRDGCDDQPVADVADHDPEEDREEECH